MAKKTPGLFKRGQIWHMRKKVHGRVISGSTGTSCRETAERILERAIEEVRRVHVFGERPTVTFRDAAVKYAKDRKDKRSIERDLQSFELLEPFIGDMDIRFIHMGTLREFIEDRQEEVKNSTINRDLASLRQVLNRAARVWRHENNLPYLDTAPLIEQLPNDNRPPCAITMDEQKALFGAMKAEYARYALFLVNTGGRSRETLKLRWDWQLQGYPAFLIPGEYHKNGKARLLVCNSVARSVLEAQKGLDPELVFPIQEQAFRMAWDRAREKVGLTYVRRHDLKHTFGMRLRAGQVPFEDRQDLLGHSSNRITDHYSAPDVERLLESAEKVVGSRASTALRVIHTGATAALQQAGAEAVSR